MTYDQIEREGQPRQHIREEDKLPSTPYHPQRYSPASRGRRGSSTHPSSPRRRTARARGYPALCRRTASSRNASCEPRAVLCPVTETATARRRRRHSRPARRGGPCCATSANAAASAAVRAGWTAAQPAEERHMRMRLDCHPRARAWRSTACSAWARGRDGGPSMMGAVWLLGIPTLCGNLRSRGADATELQIDVEVSRYKCLNAWLIGFILLAAVRFWLPHPGRPRTAATGQHRQFPYPIQPWPVRDKTRTVPYRYLYTVHAR